MLSLSRPFAAHDRADLVHIVINHLRLRDRVAASTLKAASEGVQLVVDAGALVARLAKIDKTHLILILEFASAEDANRIARDVGGAWMRENITPLLAGDTNAALAKVIASAEA
jgi:hypothetical protein